MTRKQKKVLKKLYWTNRLKIKVTTVKLCKWLGQEPDREFPYPFNQYVEIETIPTDDYETERTGYVFINQSGVVFIQEWSAQKIDTIFTRAIAVAALIISIIALLKP